MGVITSRPQHLEEPLVSRHVVLEEPDEPLILLPGFHQCGDRLAHHVGHRPALDLGHRLQPLSQPGIQPQHDVLVRIRLPL